MLSNPLQFGSWTPDAPDHENPGCTKAQNVIPRGPYGYGPFPDFSAFSTTPLSARCQGAISVPDTSGFTYPYAGDATKLYRLADTVWTDMSGATYNCPEDDSWEFVKYGSYVLACNISDDVQSLTIGSGTNFANHFTSTLTPKCRHMGIVKTFLVIGNVNEGGSLYPDRIRWSAEGDSQDMDQSATTLADFSDLPGDGGWVQKIIGGDYGVIFQERQISRMVFEGSPTVFRVDPLEQNRGALTPGGVIALGRSIFYLAPDGFFLFDGLQSQPIGDRKVNKYFFDNASENYNYRITSAIDYQNQVVLWSFCTTGNTTPDKILVYHWPSGWWAFANVTLDLIFNDLSKGTTLDGLDSLFASIDDVTPSLDSRVWSGGTLQVGGFNTSFNSGAFTGSNLAAVIETSARQLFPGYQATITGVEPLVDGGTLTAAVAPQLRLNDTASFGSAGSQTTEGIIKVAKSKSRYHRYQVNVAAGGTWKHAQGVKVEAVREGSR